MDNNTLILIAAVIVVILVALFAFSMSRRRKSEDLKEHFGPEYEHAVDKYGDKKRAEEELESREKRVEAFDIHPLKPEDRDRFAAEWRKTQAEFVDDPDSAIRDADQLVKQVMQTRGYPVGDFDQRAADVSVDHPQVVSHYRTAHDIALKNERGKASTEDLRQAMVHYRALFEDLLRADTAGETAAGKTTEKERVR